ncbi:type II toxin-antitoxin system Phd/YefM family antitoxin [Streptomyces sp. NPDC090025]|uniref:type II toxin-antitoxin system Phd/YefM family antitoxin n=1 Tax=Streptomyces sp. NPDC090025 TaxID=3365922 RepID=UPI0038381969
MEITAREFNRKSSRILAAAEGGETVTVTRNGVAVARVVPIGAGVPPYPTDPMGEIDLPVLDLPDLADLSAPTDLGGPE